MGNAWVLRVSPNALFAVQTRLKLRAGWAGSKARKVGTMKLIYGILIAVALLGVYVLMSELTQSVNIGQTAIVNALQHK